MEPTVNFKQAIEKLRAARGFTANLIPDAIVEEILRLARMAQSGYNLQPWRFIVVRGQENRNKLKACAFNQRQVGEVPVVLICCGDRRVCEPDYINSMYSL